MTKTRTIRVHTHTHNTLSLTYDTYSPKYPTRHTSVRTHVNHPDDEEERSGEEKKTFQEEIYSTSSSMGDGGFGGVATEEGVMSEYMCVSECACVYA